MADSKPNPSASTPSTSYQDEFDHDRPRSLIRHGHPTSYSAIPDPDVPEPPGISEDGPMPPQPQHAGTHAGTKPPAGNKSRLRKKKPSRTGTDSGQSTPASRHSTSRNRMSPEGTSHTTSLPQLDTTILSLEQLLRRKGDPSLKIHYKHFATATLDPPISKQSLSELEINAIVNNPKLRHDVNFDRDLHFRPNTDGSRGRNKLDTQRDYWSAITSEVELYQILRDGLDKTGVSHGLTLESAIRSSQRRLPLMFRTIKDIIQALVPERDQDQIKACLEPEVIMQELERGICDFVGISKWLAQLLKTHCAPMRDSMIDGMVQYMQQGDSKSISAGLRELFAILEMMKLDVANHQVRHLKPLLIEDTINFERKYSIGRIRRKRLNIAEAREWFRICVGLYSRPRLLIWCESCDSEDNDADAEDSDSDSLRPAEEQQSNMHVTSIITNAPTKANIANGPIPDSEAFYFEAFIEGFTELLLPQEIKPHVPETFSLDTARIRHLRREVEVEVHLGICWDVFKECLAEKTHRDVALPSAAEVSIKHRLRLIIGPAITPNSLPNVVVEISRLVMQFVGGASPLDALVLEEADQLLQNRLAPACDEFCTVTEELRAQLVAAVLTTARKYLAVSAWDVYQALLPPTSPVGTIASKSVGINELANKIAHVAILHWKVWAFAYCGGDEAEQETASESNVNFSVQESEVPTPVVQTEMPLETKPTMPRQKQSKFR